MSKPTLTPAQALLRAVNTYREGQKLPDLTSDERMLVSKALSAQTIADWISAPPTPPPPTPPPAPAGALLALDPADPSQVLVTYPAGTATLHFAEMADTAMSGIRYVDTKPQPSFRPDAATPVVDVVALDANGAAIGLWFSSSPGGSRIVTTPTPPPPPAPTPTGVVDGMNCPWFCAGNDTGQAYAQVDELAPKVIRDPGHQQARWDHAASKGIKMLALFEGTDVSALSWMVKHPAFAGVELSNEPFWNGISAASWVKTWGPVIDQIKATYPGVKILAPIDDWPSARLVPPEHAIDHRKARAYVMANRATATAGTPNDTLVGPGTSAWIQQLFAARPSLKTEIYGWAIHPYDDDSPALALSHLKNGIDALKANGVPSPRMFCTEWGWSRFNTTEANQAAYATLFLKGLPPEVEAVFWYQLNDTVRQGASGWNRDAGFGLLKEPASANWDDQWTKASVWQVMRDAITASHTFETEGA